MTSPKSSAQPVANTDPVRVMVVDDAVVARGLMTRWLDADPELAVVETSRTGKLAVDAVERVAPDVIVLDIEMPDMDGLTALPLLLQKRPGVQIVMASTLTRRNAEISLKALSLGAADYLPKPESNSGVSTSSEFRTDLIAKVKALGVRGKRTARRASMANAPGVRTARPAVPAGPATNTLGPMRRWSPAAPRVVVIGSSTGGPQALSKVVTALGVIDVRVPILITQHMPATFTAILAENLSKASGIPAAEGRDGEPVKPGQIYVAPGGKHMIVEPDGLGVRIVLTDGPPVNFCKPAVDPLFESVARNYGPAVLAAVLTGMGNDGGKGALAIANAGGSVIAQDEKTSVVWGMPQAVVEEKACSAVLPIDDVAATIARILKGGRP
ncbi:MAG: chemotaxis response regulator protein-glutamate methylesterase [Pseudomonadota bacterium]